MGRRFAPGLSLLTALLFASSIHAQSPGGLGEAFEEMVALPGGSFSAVTIRGRPGMYFLSANGRYAIRGEITDLWSGARLQSISDVRASATTLDLSALNDFWDDLAPEIFGTGPEVVTVFVDPLCPACRDHMAELEPYFETHTFRVVPVPALGKQSGHLIRQVACASDRQAARAAVLNHRYQVSFQQDANCDLRPLQRRIVVMQLLGVSEVPFSIAPSGRFHKGGGETFAHWLSEVSR